MEFLERAPRHLFFTGKGGVGKTSVACATAIALAGLGRRVLLVSTDPASNLDEVLDAPLASEPRPIAGAPGLCALNVDPEAAARTYRERVVGPYRGVLPDAAVRSIEEQLSGACTLEITAFDAFSKLLGDPRGTEGFEHVVFDTAPTGHTLRLLELPAAWTGFLEANVGGTSCLGPLSGMLAQQGLYEGSRRALTDATRTVIVLVARPDVASLREAERARGELAALGITRQELVLHGIFHAADEGDALAVAMARRGAGACAGRGAVHAAAAARSGLDAHPARDAAGGHSRARGGGARPGSRARGDSPVCVGDSAEPVPARRHRSVARSSPRGRAAAS